MRFLMPSWAPQNTDSTRDAGVFTWRQDFSEVSCWPLFPPETCTCRCVHVLCRAELSGSGGPSDTLGKKSTLGLPVAEGRDIWETEG